MNETEINALKEGAAVLYKTVTNVYSLHAEVALEGEEGTVQGCEHCSDISEAIVHYPCPTVRVLLSDFVVEENPAE